MRVLLMGVLLAVASPQQEDSKPDLSWNLKAGETVRYELEHATLVHRTTGTAELKTRFGLLLEPGERGKDGKIPLKITLDRVEMSLKSASTDWDYDSDRDAAAPEDEVIRLMSGCVNETFEASISRNGAISEVRGLKGMMEKAAAKVRLKESESPGLIGRCAASHEGLLHDAFNVVPGKSVAKDESWDLSRNSASYGFGAAPLRSKLTLQTVRPGKAFISRSLDFDLTKVDKNPKSKGSGEGELVWSTERGLLLSTTWRVTATVEGGQSELTFLMRLAPREKK